MTQCHIPGQRKPQSKNCFILKVKALKPLKTSGSNLMFCCPYIKVYQYSETKSMHFLFNLLILKGLCMFRALLAHPQEEPHCDSWYIACYVSWLLGQLVYCVLRQLAAQGLEGVQAKWQHTSNVPSAAGAVHPGEEQAMLEKCRSP
jgi:hypothetical protein